MSSVSFPWTDERSKFDFQLKEGQRREHELAGMMLHGKFEVKSESYIWERTGNIAIEYESNSRPSGIAVTEADYWVHHLKRTDGETVVWLILPIARMKQLARDAIKEGRKHEQAGDGGRQKLALVRLRDIIA